MQYTILILTLLSSCYLFPMFDLHRSREEKYKKRELSKLVEKRKEWRWGQRQHGIIHRRKNPLGLLSSSTLDDDKIYPSIIGIGSSENSYESISDSESDNGDATKLSVSSMTTEIDSFEKRSLSESSDNNKWIIYMPSFDDSYSESDEDSFFSEEQNTEIRPVYLANKVALKKYHRRKKTEEKLAGLHVEKRTDRKEQLSKRVQHILPKRDRTKTARKKKSKLRYPSLHNLKGSVLALLHELESQSSMSLEQEISQEETTLEVLYKKPCKFYFNCLEVQITGSNSDNTPHAYSIEASQQDDWLSDDNTVREEITATFKSPDVWFSYEDFKEKARNKRKYRKKSKQKLTKLHLEKRALKKGSKFSRHVTKSLPKRDRTKTARKKKSKLLRHLSLHNLKGNASALLHELESQSSMNVDQEYQETIMQKDSLLIKTPLDYFLTVSSIQASLLLKKVKGLIKGPLNGWNHFYALSNIKQSLKEKLNVPSAHQKSEKEYALPHNSTSPMIAKHLQQLHKKYKRIDVDIADYFDPRNGYPDLSYWYINLFKEENDIRTLNHDIPFTMLRCIKEQIERECLSLKEIDPTFDVEKYSAKCFVPIKQLFPEIKNFYALDKINWLEMNADLLSFITTIEVPTIKIMKAYVPHKLRKLISEIPESELMTKLDYATLYKKEHDQKISQGTTTIAALYKKLRKFYFDQITDNRYDTPYAYSTEDSQEDDWLSDKNKAQEEITATFKNPDVWFSYEDYKKSARDKRERNLRYKHIQNKNRLRKQRMRATGNY